MTGRRVALRTAAAAVLLAATAAPALAHVGTGRVDHVLLLSVDGLHQSDLARYTFRHLWPALAESASDVEDDGPGRGW
jgi:hypothetical protein